MARHNGLLAFLFFASATLSLGTTFTYNDTITLDPSQITTSPGRQDYTQFITGATQFSVVSGDTITGTITFANGPIEFSGAGIGYQDISLFFPAIGSSPTFSNSGYITFEGLTGTLTVTNPTPSRNSSGPALAVSESSSGVYDFSFTAIDYSLSVTSVSSAPTTVSFYQISVTAPNVSFGTAAAPEPSSLILIALGAAGIAIFAKRRPTPTA